MANMADYMQNYVGGEWVDGIGGHRIEVDDPATGEPFAEVARATQLDVERAVEAARACVSDRSLIDMRPAHRGRHLTDMARWLRDHAGDIAPLLTRESGKTLRESEWEVGNASAFLEYYGGLADKIEGRYIPLGYGYTDYSIPVPYGVSAHIVPWNYPLELTARGIGPALAAGNAVVVKSPELDPLAVTYLGRAAEAVGLPAGALNIICGNGHDAGSALATHRDIDQITFTGSVETGQSILHAAADSVIPAVVEMGGKSAGIVLPDADLDIVTEQTRWGIFSNAGQVCSALSRLIVPESMHDEIVDRLVDMAQSLVVGPGRDNPDMGPIITKTQVGRVAQYVRIGKGEGASVATGGERMEDLPGHFYMPTIMVGVTNDMTIAREEIFGPVLAVIPYENTNEALAIANDSEYGLVGGVFGADLDQITLLAERLEVGQVFINEWFQPAIEAPFGGFKRSGFGREKGQAALGSYYTWRNIAISRKARP